MKAEQTSSYLAVGIGLLALLAVISITVYATAPDNKAPPEQLLVAHECFLYFIEGKSMAKRLYPDPSARWSHILADPGTVCFPIGSGVWYAGGLVYVPNGTSPVIHRWEIFFSPDSSTPIYARVGDVQSGDFQAALQLENAFKASMGGAADGK